MTEKISEILLRLLLWFYHVPLVPCVDSPAPCKVTLLAPHPDDETIGCGGVLRQHVLRGDDVTVIIVTDGSRSTDEVENLAERREAESHAAVSELIGVKELRFWRYPDQRMRATPIASNQLIETVQELQTDILYVPSAWDLHPDHIATARLADSAAKYVSKMVRMYEIFCPLTPRLLNRCVDISNVLDVKTRATQAFTSQHVSFSSALMLNRVQAAMTHKPKVRAVEGFLELTPAQYSRFVNILANTTYRPKQVRNYRNVLYAYLVNLCRAKSIAQQIANL